MAANGMTIVVDTKEFDKKLKEYMNYSSRTFAEAVNQHAFYIARNAVNVTKAVSKDEIANELNAPSKKSSRAPLGAILANKRLKAKGESGKSGAAMAAELGRFIRYRQKTRNFIRAGWMPAIQELARVVRNRGGKSLQGTKARGTRKGGSTAAIQRLVNFSPTAWIWNSVHKLRSEGFKEMEIGAVKAIKEETISMQKYIENKMAEASKKAWGS